MREEMRSQEERTREEMRLQEERTREEMRLQEERMRKQMRSDNEQLRELIRSESEQTRAEIQRLADAFVSHYHDADGNIRFQVPPAVVWALPGCPPWPPRRPG